MKTRIILAGAAIAALAIPAVAQMNARSERGAAMTRADVETRVKDRFAKLDIDRDGAVTQEEAKQAREAKREERRDRRFAMMDADKNGSISRAEFDAAGDARAERPRRGHAMRRAMKMRHGGMEGGLFARADTDKNGRVTLNEMLTPAMERFDRADANRDGTITPEERRDARQKMREGRRAKRG